ncbi:MAG: glycine cleavage T C-terminal barrel domain-containing protein [Gemmataceae bacterium]
MTAYESAISSSALFDVSNRGKIEFVGPDAPSFLHNLCTNDVANLPLGGGCEAFFTTAKAKIVGRALIYHARSSNGEDALWLDTDPGQAERLLQHLSRYQIAERFEMSDRTADFAQFHLAGPAAHDVLSRALKEPVPDIQPLMHMERTFGANATCSIRRNDTLGLPGYDIVCLKSRAEDVRRLLLDAGAALGSEEAYEVLRVEAGTPVVGIDLDENRFVVETGRMNAISYAKGCYLGQEPIVMARDRAGHVNRAFRGLRLAAVVPPGTKLFAGDKDVGVTASSLVSPRFGAIALAFVRRGSETPGTRLDIAGTPSPGAAEVVALPMR